MRMFFHDPGGSRIAVYLLRYEANALSIIHEGCADRFTFGLPKSTGYLFEDFSSLSTQHNSQDILSCQRSSTP
jgi:hypothetical protein